MKRDLQSVFIPSCFQHADRIENVDGSPMPLLHIKAFVFLEHELLELKREVGLEVLKGLLSMSDVQMKNWIHEKYSKQNEYIDQSIKALNEQP